MVIRAITLYMNSASSYFQAVQPEGLGVRQVGRGERPSAFVTSTPPQVAASARPAPCPAANFTRPTRRQAAALQEILVHWMFAAYSGLFPPLFAPLPLSKRASAMPV